MPFNVRLQKRPQTTPHSTLLPLQTHCLLLPLFAFRPKKRTPGFPTAGTHNPLGEIALSTAPSIHHRRRNPSWALFSPDEMKILGDMGSRSIMARNKNKRNRWESAVGPQTGCFPAEEADSAGSRDDARAQCYAMRHETKSRI